MSGNGHTLPAGLAVTKQKLFLKAALVNLRISMHVL
jgi:hypothetical protein